MIELAEQQDPTPETQVTKVSGFDMVPVRRWVIYFQGALLGVVAVTFFIFGLMVGHLTSGGFASSDPQLDCRVAGRVSVREGDELQPDQGAVILLLPKSKRPEERVPARPLSPDGFRALDNPGIDLIHQLGGAVVRADGRGMFEVVIDGPADYYVVVVSKQRRNAEGESPTKKQRAVMGTFVKPVEDLLDDRAFFFSSVSATKERMELPGVEF